TRGMAPSRLRQLSRCSRNRAASTWNTFGWPERAGPKSDPARIGWVLDHVLPPPFHHQRARPRAATRDDGRRFATTAVLPTGDRLRGGLVRRRSPVQPRSWAPVL